MKEDATKLLEKYNSNNWSYTMRLLGQVYTPWTQLHNFSPMNY